MIPKKLEDPTTIFHNHTMLTYLPCVLIRISLGLAIIYGLIPHIGISVIALIIVVMFSLKLYLNTWKNYLRTIIIYSLVIIILNVLPENNNKNLICGLLVIFDAILGQQSRFTAGLLG